MTWKAVAGGNEGLNVPLPKASSGPGIPPSRRQPLTNSFDTFPAPLPEQAAALLLSRVSYGQGRKLAKNLRRFILCWFMFVVEKDLLFCKAIHNFRLL